MNGHSEEVGQMLTKIKFYGINQAVTAQLIQLDVLEKRKDIQILGLIGQSVFRKYEIFIDLIGQEIKLFPIKRKEIPK